MKAKIKWWDIRWRRCEEVEAREDQTSKWFDRGPRWGNSLREDKEKKIEEDNTGFFLLFLNHAGKGRCWKETRDRTQEHTAPFSGRRYQQAVLRYLSVGVC